MHKTTGQWKLGLGLALVTALLWSILPVALKLLLGQMDAYTITWYRFLAATVLLGAFQMRRKALPSVRILGRHGWLLLGVAIVGLMGNYLLYLLGLDFITPGAAQMVIQLAPVLLLIGGLVVFGERFSRLQWLGLAVLVFGLALFFNHRLVELFSEPGSYASGVVIIIVAAFAWAAYALAQKQLLKHMASENIMLLIYAAGVMIFLLPADLGSVLKINQLGLLLLIFASINTLVAYGSFAEALDHWEASRVSAVLAITPMLTLAWMALLNPLSNDIQPEPLNQLSIIGGALVVGGSMLMSLAGRQAKKDNSIN
jgi:drug/metabolite transporter (DMT)-like permease